MSTKKRMTMAKRAREQALKERRAAKHEKKQAAAAAKAAGMTLEEYTGREPAEEGEEDLAQPRAD